LVIFGFGYRTSGAQVVNITNLVSNTGVVAANQTELTGTSRQGLAAAGYGVDKAIFGFGNSGATYYRITNLISNTGVVAADQATLTGTARTFPAAAGYGGDKAIFGYGTTGSAVSLTNLVSNLGVVIEDVTGVGTARLFLAATSYSS
jgi:hypothetical protein